MKVSLCCWQPVLTAHQAHTFDALAESAGWEVKIVCSRANDSVRAAQGWKLGGAALVPEILPVDGWQQRIREIVDEDPDRVHLFGSPFERARQNYALWRALRGGRRVFLLSEPYSNSSAGYLSDANALASALKRTLRPLVYGFYGRLLRRRVSGVFAISPAAVRQYCDMGVPPDRVFPFGYFVPSGMGAGGAPPAGRPLRVAYLGSFIRRKDVATLIAAFTRPEVAATGATLDLFGPRGGPLGALPGNATYRGPLPFGDVQPTLATYDLLVVPSLFDGWGVVVNEAILAGTPVFASKGVGAAEMVEEHGAGERFPVGDVPDLARRLARLAQDPQRLEGYRTGAHALAPLIEPPVAARYLADCILATVTGKRPPAAPWYSSR